jgi:pyruvate/2-oxoglutarate dehydrogenase complex dihydrolipoamide dehydrogenase (E3) component
MISSVAGIWALRDCNGRGAFTHTSYNDFEIVAANLLGNEPQRVTDRITAYNHYIDPPLGRAGMTETEVRASGRPALIAKMPTEKVGRAFEKSETQGFMKILVDKETKLILGASLLGVGRDEVIHTILDLMYVKAPFTVLQRAMHVHPTVSDFLPRTGTEARQRDPQKWRTRAFQKGKGERFLRASNSLRAPRKIPLPRGLQIRFKNLLI